ncbi:MAG: acetyl-CoA carboxylase biotin carboxyl carrier protein subunit, partial [Acidobacteria bacterium]|nr:acetyl-CoA carboxylase biotin carboxyl carrier protein subunit [Acidobacteriota bacterium]
KVIEIRFATGDSVSAGDVVAVLEAMKMENHLRAPRDGVIREIGIAVGDQIEKDMILMVIETIEDRDDQTSRNDGEANPK